MNPSTQAGAAQDHARLVQTKQATTTYRSKARHLASREGASERQRHRTSSLLAHLFQIQREAMVLETLCPERMSSAGAAKTANQQPHETSLQGPIRLSHAERSRERSKWPRNNLSQPIRIPNSQNFQYNLAACFCPGAAASVCRRLTSGTSFIPPSNPDRTPP